MSFRVSHTTLYNYSQTVEMCQNEARLKPRNFDRQTCDSTTFDITPSPSELRERTDFFGNTVTYFAIEQPHNQLRVVATSEVTILPQHKADNENNPIAWETVRTLFQDGGNLPTGSLSPLLQEPGQIEEIIGASKYLHDSPMVDIFPAITDYASRSFLPDRPLVDVVHGLMTQIYSDFVYDPAFTTIATPLSDVLNFRRGVCQDFAHLAISCMRAFGIPARYVSGYIETVQIPGEPRLVGADASHAWFSVYIPNSGWVDFDPTNNTVPFDQHITLAWGRDYSDVAPLKGIAQGGGEHTLSVAVDVIRL